MAHSACTFSENICYIPILLNEQHSSSEKLYFVCRVIAWSTQLSSSYPKSYTFVTSCTRIGTEKNVFQVDLVFKKARTPPHLPSAPPSFFTDQCVEIGKRGRRCKETMVFDLLLILRRGKGRQNSACLGGKFSRAIPTILTNSGPQKVFHATVFFELSRRSDGSLNCWWKA